MQRILALARKDLKLLLRDKPGFFFTFFFPLLYASFFGLIMSGMGGSMSLNVAVVDEDGSDGSKAFVGKLVASAEIRVRQTDRANASDLVRRGKCTAYVLLPAGFGRRVERPFADGLPEIEAGIDPSRKGEEGLLRGVLTKYLFEQIVEVYQDPDRVRKIIADAIGEVTRDTELNAVSRAALLVFLPALDRFLQDLPRDQEGEPKVGKDEDFFGSFIRKVPITREGNRPRSAFEITTPQGIVWALLSCAASFGISLVAERTKGTLIRIRMTPVTPSKLLAGKALACFVTTVAMSVMLLLFSRAVFGVRPDSLVLLGLAIVCSCGCFVGIMLFLSVLGRTEQAAGGMGWGILTILAMIGGGMIPLFVMPEWLQRVSHISPIKWTIYALEGAIWRGFSFGEMLFPCFILLGIGVLCLAVAIPAFRWSEAG